MKSEFDLSDPEPLVVAVARLTHCSSTGEKTLRRRICGSGSCKTATSTKKVNDEPVSEGVCEVRANVCSDALARSVPTLEMSAAVKKPIAATQTSSGQPVAKFYGVRASARTAAKRLGLSDRKALKSIDMDKGDKVKDLKPKVSSPFARGCSCDESFLTSERSFEQIEAETGIPIIAQRIFYNLQELDGSQSVQELGLIGDATIEVYGVRFDDDLDLNDLKDVDVDQIDRMSNGKRGGKKRAREEGFGGTGLTGWDRQDADDSDSASRSSGTGANGAVEMPAEDEADTSGSSRAGKRSRSDSEAISAAMQVDDEDAGDVRINCPACTFLNDPGLVECEVCGSSMAG